MFLRMLIIGLGVLVQTVPVVGGTDGPKPFPEFQAKRVKPPTGATGKRITIQIEPAPITASVAETVAPLAKAAVSQSDAIGQYSWFWDKVSPEMQNSRPGRLASALQVLNGAGDIRVPRLQAMQDIAKARGIPILASTVGTNVSPALVLAVIAVESAGREDAVSPAGASGLMQLMPATAERFGVKDVLEASDNIAGGVRYLDFLMKKFDNDPILVLAGYNAGEGSVRRHDGVPPYPETRDYVPKVLAAFQVARGLCATPPELISDGCVFVAMN